MSTIFFHGGVDQRSLISDEHTAGLSNYMNFLKIVQILITTLLSNGSNIFNKNMKN